MFGRKTQDAETVVAVLAAAIRRDIAFGVLPPDAKLKIEPLRAQYGGSAHSMREALLQISVEGLVEANAQRGFRVASATQADLEDITRLRVEIECLGLRWSMERGDIDWEGRVVAARHSLSRTEREIAADPLGLAMEWEEFNHRFHAALIEACGSPRLLQMHERLYNQSRRFRLAALKEDLVDFDVSRADHDALLVAVLEHDPDTAIATLKAHITGNHQRKDEPSKESNRQAGV